MIRIIKRPELRLSVVLYITTWVQDKNFYSSQIIFCQSPHRSDLFCKSL